jgi:hypothetical protein
MKNIKAAIYDQINSLAIAFGTPQTKERIMIYAEELSEFDQHDIIRAIKRAKIECKFFPSLSEIVDFIKLPNGNPEEVAVRIANEIIECISKFGPYQTLEVKNHLGENWGVVERFGGWRSLCEISNEEIPTTKAQLRELAKSYILRSKRESSGPMSLDTSTENKRSLEKIDFQNLISIK